MLILLFASYVNIIPKQCENPFNANYTSHCAPSIIYPFLIFASNNLFAFSSASLSFPSGKNCSIRRSSLQPIFPKSSREQVRTARPLPTCDSISCGSSQERSRIFPFFRYSRRSFCPPHAEVMRKQHENLDKPGRLRIS